MRKLITETYSTRASASSLPVRPFIHISLVMLLFVSAFTIGCRDRPDHAYYRDRLLCGEKLRQACADIRVAMLESGKPVADMNAQRHFRCPVTAKCYAVNPEVGLWQDMDAPNEVAIICTEYHPSMPKDHEAYLAITFDFQLMELSQLPAWATPISDFAKADR